MVSATLVLLLTFALKTPPLQEAPPEHPVRISSGVLAAQRVRVVEPVFPAEARAAHVDGEVVMQVLIGKDGKVRDASVISGPEMLRKSYLQAVKQWEYKPYLLNGRPVEVTTQVSISYQWGKTLPEESKPSAPAPGSAQVSTSPLPPGRIHISAGVLAARKLSGEMPGLCDISVAQHVSAHVELHIVLDRSGNISEAKGVGGSRPLWPQAVDAIRTWKYKPFLSDVEPVEVDSSVAVFESCGR